MSAEEIQDLIDSLEVMRGDIQDHIVDVRTAGLVGVQKSLELVDSCLSNVISYLEGQRDFLLEDEKEEEEEEEEE